MMDGLPQVILPQWMMKALSASLTVKDMILVSGFNVYPNEVEEVVTAHPKVLESAVIGVPSKSSGETVKSFVVKKIPH